MITLNCQKFVHLEILGGESGKVGPKDVQTLWAVIM